MIGYSLTVSFLLAWIIDKTMGFRIIEEEEEIGMDLSLHDESAYDFDSILSGVSSALTGGESINPFAKPVTATEGE